jgi:hypothetical protein
MAAGEPAVPAKKVNYFIKVKKDAAGMSQDFLRRQAPQEISRGRA